MSKLFYKHKLVLDEQMPHRDSFSELNNLFDLKHVAHDLKKSGASDVEVYKIAVLQNRIIMTQNIKHFRPLAGTKKRCRNRWDFRSRLGKDRQATHRLPKENQPQISSGEICIVGLVYFLSSQPLLRPAQERQAYACAIITTMPERPQPERRTAGERQSASKTVHQLNVLKQKTKNLEDRRVLREATDVWFSKLEEQFVETFGVNPYKARVLSTLISASVIESKCQALLGGLKYSQ